jgi:hypothetical protein
VFHNLEHVLSCLRASVPQADLGAPLT